MKTNLLNCSNTGFLLTAKVGFILTQDHRMLSVLRESSANKHIPCFRHHGFISGWQCAASPKFKSTSSTGWRTSL